MLIYSVWAVLSYVDFLVIINLITAVAKPIKPEGSSEFVMV